MDDIYLSVITCPARGNEETEFRHSQESRVLESIYLLVTILFKLNLMLSVSNKRRSIK